MIHTWYVPYSPLQLTYAPGLLRVPGIEPTTKVKVFHPGRGSILSGQGDRTAERSPSGRSSEDRGRGDRKHGTTHWSWSPSTSPLNTLPTLQPLSDFLFAFPLQFFQVIASISLSHLTFNSLFHPLRAYHIAYFCPPFRGLLSVTKIQTLIAEARCSFVNL